MAAKHKATITKTCQYCLNSFNIRKDIVDRRGAKFCSHNCSNLSRTRPAELRLWEKVQKGGADDCWPWTGYLNESGYGQIMVQSPKNCTEDTGRKSAHVFAWETVNGPMPAGMIGCHSCDNPPCCNPAHVFPGTYQDNVDDMHSKGRGVTGNRKLTAAQVAEIRSKYKPFAYTQKMLAAEYSISVSAIEKIIARKLWPCDE